MKKGGIIIFRFLSLAVIMSLYSCIDHEAEATYSLNGDWKVDEVMITFGSSSISQDSVWRFEGDLGNFSFDNSTVQYNYLEEDLNQQGEDEYRLTYSLERMGFHRERKWILKLSDREYEVQFDDRTRKAHVNANKITLIHQQVVLFPDIFSTIILEMSKVE